MCIAHITSKYLSLVSRACNLVVKKNEKEMIQFDARGGWVRACQVKSCNLGWKAHVEPVEPWNFWKADRGSALLSLFTLHFRQPSSALWSLFLLLQALNWLNILLFAALAAFYSWFSVYVHPELEQQRSKDIKQNWKDMKHYGRTSACF